MRINVKFIFSYKNENVNWEIKKEVWKLTAALNEEGVEEKYFKPVYTKRKKVIGYVFTTENIFPQGVYKDSNYQVERICEVCGNVSLKENVEKCLVETKFINMKNVTDFQNVNYTHEFYEGHRQIIISTYNSLNQYNGVGTSLNLSGRQEAPLIFEKQVKMPSHLMNMY